MTREREGAKGGSRRRFLIGAASAGPALWLGRVLGGCGDDGDETGADAAPARGDLERQQAATLRALCARLIPADDDPGAVDAGAHEYIEVELGTRSFRSSRQGVLDALDGLDALARRRGGQPFAELDGEAQDRLLIGLQTGEIEARGWAGERTLQLLLSLTLEGYLGAPVYGGNRDEAGWETIGFHRCGPQPRPDTIRRDPAEHRSMQPPPADRDQFDAVVVGSGAGGAPVAQLLAEAGMEVLVLEKGPWYTKRDFVHDEIGMSRRDFFVPSPEVDPHVVVEADRRPRRTNEGWTSRCVGGGTVHMTGFFLRMHPEDLRLRTLVGGDLPGAQVADWPIEYEELSRHYGWVERAMGISGAWRSGLVGAPLPLPPLRSHPFAAMLDEGAHRIGAETFTTPRAVLSRAFGGRPPCTYCGYCGSYGCENDSKSTALSVFLPRALATGRCRVWAGCQAREVLVDGQGRARGVRYLDADGDEREVRARVVVLACSAVETARLLLMSDGGRHPRGLANSSGLVGRNLLMSTFAGGEGWLSRRSDSSATRQRALDSTAPFLGRSSQSWYWLPRAGLPHPKGGTVVFLIPHINPIHTAEHLARSARRLTWGEPLKDRMRAYYRDGRVMEFEVFAEFLPTDGTRVTLDPEVTDHNDLPAARITLARHEADVEVARHLVDRGLEVLEAAGCSSPRGVAIGQATQILQGGTCRFGASIDEAVLDRDCQAFDVPNLFVTDGAFMPTSGAVPITLTIMANAARVARRIIERSQRGELT